MTQTLEQEVKALRRELSRQVKGKETMKRQFQRMIERTHEAKRQMTFCNYICKIIKEHYGHEAYFEILEMANEKVRKDLARGA